MKTLVRVTLSDSFRIRPRTEVSSLIIVQPAAKIQSPKPWVDTGNQFHQESSNHLRWLFLLIRWRVIIPTGCQLGNILRVGFGRLLLGRILPKEFHWQWPLRVLSCSAVSVFLDPHL